MIRSIAGGQGISINNNVSTSPWVDMSRMSAGLVRWNGITSMLEIYDGFNWTAITATTPLVELSPDVHELLRWAKNKRDQESKLLEIIQKYPQLRDAVDEYQLAKEKLEILQILLNENQKE